MKKKRKKYMRKKKQRKRREMKIGGKTEKSAANKGWKSSLH